MRITYDTHGKWNDLDCLTKLPFACSVRKNPNIPVSVAPISPINCPVGYYTSEESKSCFKPFTTAKSWKEAQLSCQNEGKTKILSYCQLATYNISTTINVIY